jgi:hypothetical protein
VAFSTRLSIRDPKVPSNTASSLDSSIIFELVTTTKVGISGLLEEQEDTYGVVVFECDQDNNRLPFVRPKSQQEPLRLCIEPDESTKNDAVGMYGIVSLSLEDDMSTQPVMVEGLVQNSATTEYSCLPDGKLCYVETSVQNSFFVAEQIVHATGIAKLQYEQDNGRRGLVEAPFRVHRRTRTAGGPAGQKPFDLAFAVEPSNSTYDARAYMCDQSQNELAEDEIKPTKHGERIFVCVAPTLDAQNQGIFIRDIKSFVFTKDEEEQLLAKSITATSAEIVDGNGDSAPNDQENNGAANFCTSGDEVCSFGIVFIDSFFNGNGEPIIGKGEVELQFGSGKGTWVRRMSVSFSSHRNFIDRSMQESDPDFAGVAPVSVTVPVDPTSIGPSTPWASQSLNLWMSMPMYARVLAILGIILGVLACIVGAWCFIYGLDSYHFNPFFKPSDELVYEYEDHEPDFTDPENFPLDTVEELKGGGRGRSREPIDRKVSQARSQSPGRNTNDSVATKSTSSLSEASRANIRGRSRDPIEGRMRSISPTRFKNRNGKYLNSKSCHDRIDTEIKREQRARTRSTSKERLRTRSTSKERMRSCSPFSRSRGGALKPSSTQTFIGLGKNNRGGALKPSSTQTFIVSGKNNSGKQSRSKEPDKPASIDNLLKWFGKTGQWEQSPLASKSRARSLSPSGAIRGSNPMKSTSVHEYRAQNDRKPPKNPRKKLPKQGSSPQKKASEGFNTKKSASTHSLGMTTLKQASSVHSSKSVSDSKKNTSSSTHSRKKNSDVLVNKNFARSSNPPSIGTGSSVCEESVDSEIASLKAGRKNDLASTNSTHSAQSFASSSGSFCSTDSEMDLSTDTTGVRRVRRPNTTEGKKKMKLKKTKGTKMSNSYDIVNRLE